MFFLKTTRTIVYIGLLIALEVILTRFLSIQTPIIRIGFGFIPVALASIMFGPIWGGVSAALADIIGMALFPQGAYFPGFTFSALLSGVIYGIFLYKKPVTILRVSIAVLLVTLAVDLGLNTLWLSMIMGKGFYAIFVPRIIKSAIMLPIEVICIHSVWKYIGAHINLHIVNSV